MDSQIKIYTASDSQIQISVTLDQETVWLNRNQLASLFDRDVKTIGKHLNNIFQEQELEASSVVAKFATTAQDGKTYQVEHYNLDVIISLGYRVKSKQGVRFRQWATKVLKDHLIQGYTLNKERLSQNYTKLNQAFEYLKSFEQTALSNQNMLGLIQDFSKTWLILDHYDKNDFPQANDLESLETSLLELVEALQELKNQLIKLGQATELFASEKETGKLEGIFGNVFQSVFGQDAYPSLKEKAAHLLYFIVKNHPFNDGNKRSAAFAFIWLLSKGKPDFRQQIKPETLSTLTLLVATSDPQDKDKIVGLILLLLDSVEA